ncbi:hypothetical protein IMZ38_06295 [Thermosphaera chiliense]|uniref:Uncharacterized protein n=1 Tax=Thermosphaera chiliense TaxID=3402707 RepID=A0A7M1UPM4_9CREN|nr:hypothetical protein IMZ38_06295 [Thermosphaera aggregans]
MKGSVPVRLFFPSGLELLELLVVTEYLRARLERVLRGYMLRLEIKQLSMLALTPPTRRVVRETG